MQFGFVLHGSVWFYCISTIAGCLMPNPVFTFISNIWFINTFCRYTHLVKWSNSSISNHSILHDICLHSVWMSNGSIWPIDRTLSGITTWGQSWPGSDGNEWVLQIPKSSSITGALTIRLFNVISRALVGGALTLL